MLTVAPQLLHAFPTFAIGGAQVRFARIANHFGARYRHAIVAMDGNLACRERLDPSLSVTFPNIKLHKSNTFGNVRRIREFLRVLKPQVLVTSNWGTIEWALGSAFSSVRHIHMEDGFGPDEQAQQLQRRIWMRRVALRRSDVMLPTSILMRIAIKEWHLPQTRLHYVPNGVDLHRFAARRRDWGPSPVIGTVAALRPEKNLSRLLRAFASLNVPARLVIVGDGGERGALEVLARELRVADRVRFAGYVAEPSGEYADFDLFALSSDTEQMPFSVLEAMAAGLPVATTDVGEVRTMLADANAPFVVARNDKALAGALTALLSQPAEAQQVGSANRVKAAHAFNETVMFQNFAALFDGKS